MTDSILESAPVYLTEKEAKLTPSRSSPDEVAEPTSSCLPNEEQYSAGSVLGCAALAAKHGMQLEETPSNKRKKQKFVSQDEGEVWLQRRIPETPGNIRELNIEWAKLIEIGAMAQRVLHTEESIPPQIARMYNITDGKITLELQADLEEAALEGAKSRTEFAEANLRLVVSIAGQRKYQGRGLTFRELVNEGVIGLDRAIDIFDYKLGFTFSTYAPAQIEKAIGRAIHNTGRFIRLPVHIEILRTSISRTKRHLTRDLGREPTPEEIADKINEREDDEAKHLTPERVKEVDQLGREPVSLSEPSLADNEDSDLLSERISDENATAHFDEVDWAIDNALTAEGIRTLLEKLRLINQPSFEKFSKEQQGSYLTERQYDIICRLNGIDSSLQSAAQVARTLAITVNAVNAHKRKAYLKLTQVLKQFS